MKEQLLALATIVSTLVLPASPSAQVLLSPIPKHLLVTNIKEQVLAEHSLDLTLRDQDTRANQGFGDNILLALHYLKGDPPAGGQVNWEKIRAPFETSFTLQSGEIFAFHDNVLPEFSPPAGGPLVTMNSEFLTTEGYKSVWGLGGNGVCHLASLMNWMASEGGLMVVAPNKHNFALIPGVPREYGTSIRSQSANQNLYIRNNFAYPVTFVFKTNNREVDLKIVKGI